MYGLSGYDEIIGGLDELDALDAAGAAGPEISIGQDDSLAELMAAAGYDEIIGAEDKALARVAKKRGLAKLAARMQIAREVDPHAVAVVDRPQDRRREFPVGLIAATTTIFGASGSAVAFPQVTFRPERLIIPSTIAPSFRVDSIVVGKDNQSVSAAALPADMFSEVAVGVRLNLKTAVVGMQIVVSFTNIDALQRTLQFSAAFIGTAVE